MRVRWDKRAEKVHLPFLRQQKGDAERSERRGFTHNQNPANPQIP